MSETDKATTSQQQQQRAQELKEQGNKKFGEGDYSAAAELYTQAIAANPPGTAVLFSNRANARLKAQEYEGALEDAVRAIELDPTFVKAHHRRALALLALNRPREAAEALASALGSGGGCHGCASEDRGELVFLLTRAEVEYVRGADPQLTREQATATLDTLEHLQGFDLVDAKFRKPLAEFVVACELRLADDARLAAVARAVATGSQEGAAALCGFHGMLEAIVAIAGRAAQPETQASKTLCDAARALAAATAGRAEGKAALIKAGIVGLARRVLGNAETGAGLLQELLTAPAGSASREADESLGNVLEAVAELASHSDDVRRELQAAGAVPVLMELVRSSTEGDGARSPVVRAMAASALGSLCELDAIRTELIGLDIVKALTPLIEAGNSSEMLEAADALRVVVETADGAKAVVADARAMDAIFSRAPFEESAARLVCDLAAKAPECVPTAELVRRIPLIAHGAGSPRATAVALTGLAAQRSEAAETVLTEGKELFMQWVQQTADRELRASGIMLLANVARSEHAVTELISTAEMLVRLIEEECRRPEIVDDTRVLLATLAALRNFAVPRPNRELLAEAGVVRGCVLALQTASRKDLRVAFEACVLLLAVIRGSPRRASMLAGEEDALTVLMKIAKGEPVREGDQPVVAVDAQGHRDLRVQYEAGRLVAELCCSLNVDGAKALWQLGALESLKLLAASKFDVLAAEANRAAQALKAAGIDVPELKAASDA